MQRVVCGRLGSSETASVVVASVQFASICKHTIRRHNVAASSIVIARKIVALIGRFAHIHLVNHHAISLLQID